MLFDAVLHKTNLHVIDFSVSFFVLFFLFVFSIELMVELVMAVVVMWCDATCVIVFVYNILLLLLPHIYLNDY